MRWHQEPVVRYGSYQLLDPADDQVFAYLREYQGITLLVINNFTDKIVQRDYDQVKGELALANYPAGQLTEFRPYESRVYVHK